MEKFARSLVCRKSKLTCQVAAWASLTLGVVALGLFAGREMRLRYRFNRRTPYDFFAHAGDSAAPVADYGVGV